MTRRAIKAEDTDEVFTRARQARLDPVIHWSGTRESIVDKISAKGRDFTHLEIDALAAVGLHPGTDGWEIEDGAPPAPAPTRAEQVRLALLAVLTRGPVEGTSRLLPAVEAEMGAQPGSVEGREVREAAREIGAYIDGPRWSLPAVPHGWGWIGGNDGDVRLYLQRASDGETIAHVYPSGHWYLYAPSESGAGEIVDEWHPGDAEEGQVAALAAARRAGLFARPVAVEVTGDGCPAVLPAVTAQGGEAVVPVAPSPLDALARHLCGAQWHESGSEGMRTVMANVEALTPLLAAWGAALVEQARAPRHTIEAVGEQDGTVMAAIPHAAVQASLAQRAYAADAPLLYAVWKASTTARDAYRAEGMSSRFSRSLVALWDILDAVEREPADPGNDLADRIADLQRAHDNAVASARKTGAEANTLEANLRAMRERAERAERDAADARAELATLQAGLDGLRTWATGAKGGAL